MKKVIAGQLMLWGNLACIVLGYYLINPLEISEGVKIFISVVGGTGAVANLVFAILLQISGYVESKSFTGLII